MRSILGEAVAASLADRPSFMAVLVTAILCSTAILGTTGQTAAAEQTVLEQIDAAGSRVVVVSDRTLQQLNAGHLDLLVATAGVEWALGFSPAQDGVNAYLPGSAGVAVRLWTGKPPAEVEHAWNVREGNALASTAALQTLGFTDLGALSTADRSSIPIVGTLSVPSPLGFLEGSAIVWAEDPRNLVLRSIHVGTDTPRAAVDVADLIPLYVQPEQPDQLVVEAPDALLRLRRAVAGELGRYGRDVLALIIGIGALLMAVSLYAKVVVTRRQLGRRRALGATRSTIVLLVVVQSLLPATLGATLSCAGYSLMSSVDVVRAVPLLFQAGIVGLIASTALYASLVPATTAAFADPAAVLRQP